jgi:hypothetical protein
MSSMSAIALPSVRHEDVVAALADEGVDWSDAGHVAATGSLARAVRDRGGSCVSIGNLLDLLVVSTRNVNSQIGVACFPQRTVGDDSDRKQFNERLAAWSSAIRGFKLSQVLRVDDVLRTRARTATTNVELVRVLVRARRQLQQEISGLIAAGVGPDDGSVQPKSDIGRAAIDAWRDIELAVPEIAHIRTDLWEGRDDPSRWLSMRRRLREVLSRVAPGDDRWTLVHHGFYFYTPPQWALFRLLDRCEGVRQVFVVHDDGVSPMFEVWRRFFTDQMSMPVPRHSVRDDSRRVTRQAMAFRSAWNGEPVDAVGLEGALTIEEFRNPAEFVRNQLEGQVGARSSGSKKPVVFAAQHQDLRRFCDRLSPEPGAESASLSQLPVGAFLLRLHECIHDAQLSSGHPKVTLSTDAVRDIALSGFVEVDGVRVPPNELRSPIQRALPYFSGCHSVSEWTARADTLERVVIDCVAVLGARDSGVTDAQRFEAAVGNPLRLVPWADLSLHEARMIRSTIHAIGKLLMGIAKGERVKLAHHADYLVSRIKAGMDGLPRHEQQAIESRLQGFRIGVGVEGDIDVTGLLDVVSILLNRDAGMDPLASDDDTVGEMGGISSIRSLDSLGYAASTTTIHVANLSDGVFPGVVPVVGWPFRREDIRGIDPVSRHLLETRAECSALEGLYLLWLALDGVDTEVPVRLSWISKIANEPRDPAAILSILRAPERLSDAVSTRIGGVKVTRPADSGNAAALFSELKAESSDFTEEEVDAALRQIPREVGASAIVCARRLAIQWLFGASASFQEPFQHVMLYGNMIGVLSRRTGLGEDVSTALCNALWRGLPEAERASSRAKAGVRPSGQRSAGAEWILTLGGSKNGSGAFDQAYQVAMGTTGYSLNVLAEQPGGFLPEPVSEPRSQICTMCPVQKCCLSVRMPRDEDLDR